MFMKNPYRITERIAVSELIETHDDYVRAEEWCRREAQRLLRAGIPARSVTCGGVCYVVRPMQGCRIARPTTKRAKREG